MYVTTDFIVNGRAHGEVAERFADINYEPGILRPYIDKNNKRVCAINTGEFKPRRTAEGQLVRNKRTNEVIMDPVREVVLLKDLWDQGIHDPVHNATSLRKDDWVRLDTAVLRAARARLKAWADLSAASSYGGFNGMATMILEQEAVSDPGEAMVDMEMLSDGRHDAPRFIRDGLPLPITYSSFWYSKRRLMVSGNKGTPLNLYSAEAAGRRVAEMVEKTLIGVVAGMTYGDATEYNRGTSKVYGYTNFPDRNVYNSLTVPTGSNPEATVADVLRMREILYADNQYGPFIIYTSNDWDLYLDNDYARLGGNNATMTLRNRLRQIDGVKDIRRLDYLTPTNSHAFTMIMVSMTSETAEAVNGMDLTTVQWESHGGAKLHFRVMCIQVPRLKSDYLGQCGILHARTA